MQDATKTTLRERIGAASQTTYQQLSAAQNSCISALLTITPPRVGQYWIGQGGYYAGIMRDGDRQWHLILAPKEQGLIDTQWGECPNNIPGEFSRRDGQHNTALILAAEPNNEIATFVRGITIDGHSDYYWPAQCENNLLFANLPEQVNREWHWSSTQVSAHLAWTQDFGAGYQYLHYKGNSLAARAVRRLPI